MSKLLLKVALASIYLTNVSKHADELDGIKQTDLR